MGYIITGASSNHFKSLKQLLNSIYICMPDFNNIIIWDLSLTDAENSELKELFPNYIFRKFDYSKYPSFFNINIDKGVYAWKPSLIFETINEFGNDNYIWLDAGCMLTIDITNIFSYIEEFGLYISDSSGMIKDIYTHQDTFTNMNADRNTYQLQNRNAAKIAFSTHHFWVYCLINLWRLAALNKNIIAPEGSSLEHHRFDQSILSILFEDFYNKLKFPIHNDILSNIRFHCDID